MTPPPNTSTRGWRAARGNTATAFAKAAVPPAASPAAADVMADLVEAPTASTHFQTVMAAIQAQGAPTGFELYVLVCSLIFRHSSFIILSYYLIFKSPAQKLKLIVNVNLEKSKGRHKNEMFCSLSRCSWQLSW